MHFPIVLRSLYIDRRFTSGARRLALTITLLLGVLGLADSVSAQWTVTNLHPPGVQEFSRLTSAVGTQQVGYTNAPVLFTTGNALLWSGTAGSAVTLTPPGATNSRCFDTTGTQQVGWVRTGDSSGGACLWNGSAASIVLLHPAGTSGSVAYATSGPNQVGVARIGAGTRSINHASLWSGTAESWIDLNPGGASLSIARDVFGSQQVGVAMFDNVSHAGLWNGTAASWVDLHPAGAASSEARGTSGAIQVGDVSFGEYTYHASLWTGTSASWVDLNPAGATDSRCAAIFGTQQVGRALIDGTYRASLWSGTADSWFDLGAFLPPGFTHSFANSIWSDGVTTSIAGVGLNALSERYEALLWTSSVPEPIALAAPCVIAVLVARRRFQPVRL